MTILFRFLYCANRTKYEVQTKSRAFVSLGFWIENASVTNSFTPNSIHFSPSGEKKMWFHRKNLNLLKKKNLFFNEFSPSIALFPRKSKIFAEKVSHFLLFRVKFEWENWKEFFFWMKRILRSKLLTICKQITYLFALVSFWLV